MNLLLIRLKRQTKHSLSEKILSKLANLLIINGALADFLIILFYMPQIGIAISGFSSALWYIVFMAASDAYFLVLAFYYLESANTRMYTAKGLIGRWRMMLALGPSCWVIALLVLPFSFGNGLLATSSLFGALVGVYLLNHATGKVDAKREEYEGKGKYKRHFS